MEVPSLTPEQIAEMLPDQLRAYLATLEAAYTEEVADLSQDMAEDLAAKRRALETSSQIQTRKNTIAGLKGRMSAVQSILKSMREGF